VPSLLVFFVCGVAVLTILADAGVRSIARGSSDPLLFQAGVYGAALFAVTSLLRALSSRLAQQERLARTAWARPAEPARHQPARHRADGAGRDRGRSTTHVRANNRAARVMLGLAAKPSSPAPASADRAEAASWPRLSFRGWTAGRGEGGWTNTPAAGADPTRGTESRIRARFARPTSTAATSS